MSSLLLKENLLVLMEQARTELRQLVTTLDPAERDRIGTLEDWSARDVYWHVCFWNNRLSERLDCVLNGGSPSRIEDMNAANDAVQQKHRLQPWSEVLAEMESSYKQAIEKVRLVSADDLVDAQRYDWLNGSTLISSVISDAVWHAVWHAAGYQIQHGSVSRAVGEYERFTEQMVKFPGWESNGIYNLACMYAQAGEKEKAVTTLRIVFKIRPELRELAKEDHDLDGVRGYMQFEALLV